MGAVISSVAVLALNSQHIFLFIVLTPCCFPPVTRRRYCTINTWGFVQSMVCLIFSASPPSFPFSIPYEIAKPHLPTSTPINLPCSSSVSTPPSPIHLIRDQRPPLPFLRETSSHYMPLLCEMSIPSFSHSRSPMQQAAIPTVSSHPI